MKTDPVLPPMPRHRFLRVTLLVFAACAALLRTAPARAADEAVKPYDVPAGEAIDTLKLAAQQGGFEIMFPAETVRGVKTAAIRGEFTSREALNRMLAGTELYVVEDSKTGALSVRRVTPAEKAPARAGAAAAGKAADGPVQLSVFEVEERRNQGYQATNTTSATRLNTPIVELSKNIEVMTRDLIDDLKVTELNESLYLSSSVSYTSQYSGRVAVRGFENAAAKRNGLGNYGSDESISDTATIERIEIVKGPSSLLYGSSSPGGVVNYETKKPISYRQDSLRLIVGSYSKYRAELDSGGPLVGDGKVLNYRFVAAHEDAESFGRYDHSRRSVVAPTVRWHLGPATYLLVGVEWNRSRRTSIRPGVYPFSATTFHGDGTRTYNDVGYILSEDARRWASVFTTPRNLHDSEVYRYDVDFSHQFTDNLNVFLHYNYIDNNLIGEAYGISGNAGYDYGLPPTAPNYPGPDELLLGVTFRNPHRKSQNGTATLHYDFKTAAFESQLIAGWEYYTFTLDQGDYALKSDYWPVVNFRTGAGYDQLDFANTYGGVLQGIADGKWTITNRYHRTQEYNAPYLLLHNYLFDRRLRVIAGIRRDEIKIKQTFRSGAPTPTDPFALSNPTYTDSKASATTPMIGVSFTPIAAQRGFAVYANYSESLVANEIVNPDGSTLPPERGKGLEAGAKLDLGDKFSGTVSWFTIDKTNLARAIPNTLPQQWEASGLQRSKGVDMDLFYAVTPDWQLMANATFLDAYYVNDGNPALVGTKLPSVPDWAWAAWTKYTFSSGPLKGFSVGGGAISRGKSYPAGEGYPALIAPQFVRFDLLFGYEARFAGHEWDFSVKVNNLFDKVYMDGSRGFGDPLSMQTSVTVKF